MKHWTTLNNMETEIIRLNSLTSVYKVLSAGAEESTPEDIREALYYIEGSLQDISFRLRQEFDSLWEDIREESFDEDEKKVKKQKKQNKENHA
jgi:hypothetical protein